MAKSNDDCDDDELELDEEDEDLDTSLKLFMKKANGIRKRTLVGKPSGVHRHLMI